MGYTDYIDCMYCIPIICIICISSGHDTRWGPRNFAGPTIISIICIAYRLYVLHVCWEVPFRPIWPMYSTDAVKSRYIPDIHIGSDVSESP